MIFSPSRSSEYLRWYEKEFPDDSSEPFQLLCWALILHRMGKDAYFHLARTMLSNIYLIPHLLGKKMDMWHALNYAQPDFVEYLPERVREAICDEDLTWIREKYESESFQKVLKRHIEINHELQTAPVGKKTERSG